MKNGKALYSRLIIALLLLAAVASVGTAQARYTAPLPEQTLPVQARENTLTVALGEWEDSGDGSYIAEVTLTDTSVEPVTVGISCLVSLGLESAAFELDGYVSAAEPIDEGSVLYTTFGVGSVVRFYDENGAEPVWTLSGESGYQAFMKLRVTPEAGAGFEPALIMVQAERRG